MKSHEALETAIRPVGAKAVAAELGVSTPLVYKWCEPTKVDSGSGSANPLDRLLGILRVTDDDGPLDWLCQQLSSYRVQNPSNTEAELSSVVDALRSILKEFTDVLDAISVADGDGRGIDTAETARIRAEWEELKRVAESFVAACESGSYAGPDG